MSDRPVILSQAMVDRAVADNNFYGRLPEFNQLRGASTISVVKSSGGCSGCRRSSQKVNLFRNFVLVATSLTPEGVGRLKRYFGVHSIMINALDSRTQQISVKVL